MLYYNGRNITLFALISILVIIWSIGFIRFWNSVPQERIVGYSIDVMITPAGQTLHDTVGVIMRKGDSVFIRGTGAYNFIREDQSKCQKKK